MTDGKILSNWWARTLPRILVSVFNKYIGRYESHSRWSLSFLGIKEIAVVCGKDCEVKDSSKTDFKSGLICAEISYRNLRDNHLDWETFQTACSLLPFQFRW